MPVMPLPPGLVELLRQRPRNPGQDMRGETLPPMQMPTPPSAPENPYLRPRPQPQQSWPDVEDPSLVQGDQMFPESGIQYDGPQLNTEAALSGLKANQETDASPFSEQELFRLAHREGGVAPGSNQMWGGRLKEQQDRSAMMQGVENDAIKGIRGAIGTLHPAVQQAAELQTRRQSRPAMVTAQGQLASAQAAADAREYAADVGQTEAEDTATMGHMTAIVNGIQNIQRKPTQTAEDRQMLQVLIGLYNSLAAPTTGATFENEP